METTEILQLLKYLERIADALESIDGSLSNIDERGIDTYEQNTISASANE
jgi:hypothetical protein